MNKSKIEKQNSTTPPKPRLRKAGVSGWRMFEATVTLKDGTKRTFISSTLGCEEEAARAAIDNDWSSPAVDAIIAFR